IQPSRKIGSYWSAPENDYQENEIGFESDDEFDQAGSSPFTCCWSAPEFVADNDQQTFDEVSSSDDASFTVAKLMATNEASQAKSCVDLMEYDEPMRNSILDFDGQVVQQTTNLINLNLASNKFCPRAISENDSLYLYDASPSPHREEEEIGFADELAKVEECVNKWTPEGVINFAKEISRENAETYQKSWESHQQQTNTVMNVSKSLGSLNLWETDIGWVTRFSSNVDHSGLVMRQSISCQEQMIQSYVDSAIQNHYNRCSSPDCHKYASKPEVVGQSMLSESDISDDEWIPCTNEGKLEENLVKNSTENDANTKVPATLYFPNNNSNNIYTTYPSDQNLQDLSAEKISSSDDDDIQVSYENIAKKSPDETVFSRLSTKNITDYGITSSENTTKSQKEEPLSYRPISSSPNILDSIPRRAYSLESFDHIPETIPRIENQLQNFTVKATEIDDERHFVEIYNLPRNHSTTTHPINNESGIYESHENIYMKNFDSNEKKKLLDFYGFTFDVKKSNITDNNGVPPTLNPNFEENYEASKLSMVLFKG
ncbi:unnamed protein product, partial [Thelazia callipaeda]|uniref:Clathrin_bdg domain-containing protein n=1 Tax=Thelazia callipaeda TaxID=103827 RepID=A0A0N5CL76_THECL